MAHESGSKSSPADSRRQIAKQKVKHELQEWTAMFVYLWVMFGLFALHQSILLAQEHQNFRLQGFALINALVLSKIMLLAEGLRFAQGGPQSRPIATIVKKSLAFALLLIVFHVVESIIVGVASGKTVAASFPELAGGHLKGIVSLAIIMSVSLVPFFAFREVSRELGEGRLLRLLFERSQRLRN